MADRSIATAEPPGWVTDVASAAQVEGLAPVSLWRVLLRSSPLIHTRRWVAVSVSLYAGADGSARVTVEELAEATALDESTVRRALGELVAAGWLTSERPSRRAARRYRLCWPESGHRAHTPDRAPVPDPSPESGTRAPESGTGARETGHGARSVGVQRCSEGVVRRRLAVMVTRKYSGRDDELDRLAGSLRLADPADVEHALAALAGQSFGYVDSQLRPAVDAKLASARRAREVECPRCAGAGVYIDDELGGAVQCDHRSAA